ncbi:MAG: hypothetical protein M1827_005929 [Pycnora praestabilis]|nr:MAG: hypothetical protein M1827_005929 [Pycnora praestabilis]
MTTVILGAGIIGVSTAYYLSQFSRTPAHQIHLIEPSPHLFASASGNAGGFLARDWFSPSVASLGALSFDLHKQLAKDHNGKERWGYSPSTGTSLVHEGGVQGKRGDEWLREGTSRADAAAEHEFGYGEGPAWLTRRRGGKVEIISEEETAAQLDPLKLSQFLLEECLERGVQLHHPAKALSVSKDLRDELSNVRIESEGGKQTDIPCTRLVFAAGAWTPPVFSSMFPSSKVKIPVTQLAGHSLVVRSPRWSREHEEQGCHAVFTTDQSGFSPEIFNRIGGEIWLGGLNSSSIPLPTLATEVKVDDKAIAQLMDTAKSLLGLPNGADDLEIVRKSLCFRPVTASGRPIVTRVPDTKLGGCMSTRGGGNGGVFVATGHGPWGISMSLGTGQVMAELIEGRATSADLRALGL